MADQEAELGALEHIMGDASAEPTRLPYTLIKSVTSDFSREIGRGGFGVVYLGVLPSGKVAVKKLSISKDFSDQLFLDEVRCLTTVKHNNIVRFLGYCSDTQGELMEHDGRNVMAEVRQRLLVFEYAPNGSLQLYITEKTIGWGRRYQMIKGICYGLEYLHRKRITHLDLKPENVLLDVYMEAKITDFGLSRWFHEGQSRIFTKSTPGTRGYIAPEIIDRGEISFKSDIFSLGIIVIKLLTGSDTYDFDNWYKSIDVNSPQVKCCIEIALTCVDTNQHNRPSIDEIIHKLNEMDSDEIDEIIQKLNEMDSDEESSDGPGSSIHQISASALKDLPPSMSCVDNQDSEKIRREFRKLHTSLAKNDDLKDQKVLKQMRKYSLFSPTPTMDYESEFHTESSDGSSFGLFTEFNSLFAEHSQTIHQLTRHNSGLNDEARQADADGGGGKKVPVDGGGSNKAGGGKKIPVDGGGSNKAGGGKKIPVDGGGSNKASGQDTKTDLVKEGIARTSGKHPSQGKMGNVASIPTVAVQSPMVGNGMPPEQVMTRYPNTMDVRPWSVPLPQQGGPGGEGGALSGREVQQAAVVAQNSMALQQQQYMWLMSQQQHQLHMAFYLFLFLLLYLFTTIVIIIVILTFRKRG